jgi:hypothetical protein
MQVGNDSFAVCFWDIGSTCYDSTCQVYVVTLHSQELLSVTCVKGIVLCKAWWGNENSCASCSKYVVDCSLSYKENKIAWLRPIIQFNIGPFVIFWVFSTFHLSVRFNCSNFTLRKFIWGSVTLRQFIWSSVTLRQFIQGSVTLIYMKFSNLKTICMGFNNLKKICMGFSNLKTIYTGFSNLKKIIWS